jgi:hypothetical protein
MKAGMNVPGPLTSSRSPACSAAISNSKIPVRAACNLSSLCIARQEASVVPRVHPLYGRMSSLQYAIGRSTKLTPVILPRYLISISLAEREHIKNSHKRYKE